jgi:hypothetical protein
VIAKLNYISEDKVISTQLSDWDAPGMVAWLHSMIESNPDLNFFFTVDSTDIWDKEWDYNTIVSYAGDGVYYHTYSPGCPEGCHGQLDGCEYKELKEVCNCTPNAHIRGSANCSYSEVSRLSPGLKHNLGLDDNEVIIDIGNGPQVFRQGDRL